MTAIRIVAMGAIAMFCAACQTASARQPEAHAAVVAAIKSEGTGRSQAPQLFHTLTDAIGPRLSGSPAHRAAARWAADRFREWGLANARLEPFEFGRGWTLEKLAAEMTMPRYMPLLAYAEAWSPATLGAVTGTPIYVGDSTVEEIDRLGARLRGAIVLANRPQSEFLRADRMEPSLGSPVKTGNPPYPDASSATPTAQLLERLRAHKAGAVLRPGAMEHGTVRVQGNRATAADAVPTVVLDPSRVAARATAWQSFSVNRPDGRRRCETPFIRPIVHSVIYHAVTPEACTGGSMLLRRRQ